MPPKFKFQFNKNVIIFGDTIAEIADKYFRRKAFYDNKTYVTYEFDETENRYVGIKYDNWQIFVSLYEKKDKLLKALKELEKDFI